MPSSFRSRSSSSASGGLRALRGARPGAGKMHSMRALVQLVHGCFLSHLTFRRRQVTQERGLRAEAPLALLMLLLWVGGEGFETRSPEPLLCAWSSWSIVLASVDILFTWRPVRPSRWVAGGGYERATRIGSDSTARGEVAQRAKLSEEEKVTSSGWVLRGARGECGEDKVEDRALKATQSGSLELGAEEEKASLAGGAL